MRSLVEPVGRGVSGASVQSGRLLLTGRLIASELRLLEAREGRVGGKRVGCLLGPLVDAFFSAAPFRAMMECDKKIQQQKGNGNE